MEVYFSLDIAICQAKMTLTNGGNATVAMKTHALATARLSGSDYRNSPAAELHIAGGGSQLPPWSYQMANLTPDQAKEFHEQFKVTYTAFVGIAAVVHLLVFASNPWF